MKYTATIGLEVHVQLKTRSKMFCTCPVEFGAAPNTHTCPVCLGLPGSLPVMNHEALLMTVLTGLMLDCDISPICKFDRKNYFYPDMPKNYQISQYDMPLCENGGVPLHDLAYPKDAQKNIATSDKEVHLVRIHLEEAFAFLTSLRQILIYGRVSDADMEKGQLRCDCNVSVRPETQAELGVKIEIKNMNSISGVRRALTFEIQRQIDTLKRGEKLQQETRGWDDAAGETFLMRTKESAHDYRYFPDPDLVPVKTEALLPEARSRVPELPKQKRARFVEQYQVTAYDAGVLADDVDLARYFETAAKGSKKPKNVANWILNDLQSVLATAGKTINDCPIPPEALDELVTLIESGMISSKQGKEVFAEMFSSGKGAAMIVKEKGIEQLSDTSAIGKLCDEVIAANPKPVADFRAGNAASLNFLKGQVMKLSKGKANPQLAGGVLERKLKS